MLVFSRDGSYQGNEELKVSFTYMQTPCDASVADDFLKHCYSIAKEDIATMFTTLFNKCSFNYRMYTCFDYLFPKSTAADLLYVGKGLLSRCRILKQNPLISFASELTLRSCSEKCMFSFFLYEIHVFVLNCMLL